jgi:hypothetical protein
MTPILRLVVATQQSLKLTSRLVNSATVQGVEHSLEPGSLAAT